MSTGVVIPGLPVLAIAFPLLVAASLGVSRLVRVAVALAPWAALPALALAFGAEASRSELPRVLVDTTLACEDPVTRGFLLLTAMLWLAAGWFSRTSTLQDPNARRFWVFFLASMAGNIGLVIARDVASFYALFALMTFAAYGLVIHQCDAEARRAARVYFVLAFLGELLLLGALFFVTRGDPAVSIDEAASIVAQSPHRDLLVLVLLAGFGVKAGAVPLHVWLPLAHPVAPTPASAVLSGAMIKAGLLGWLRFLPLGIVALPDIGWWCAVLGFAAAIGAALIGATQRRDKTILAYSSISQMGIMTIVLGVFLGAPAAVHGSFGAIVFFALHHAFAKGSLFLGTGVAHHTSRRWAIWVVGLGLLVPALSIAGAPFTAGALGKVALHDAIEHAGPRWHVFATLLSVAAVGSTLIMIRFMVRGRPRPEAEAAVPSPGLWIPWLALVGLDVAVVFFSPVETPSLDTWVEPGKLWSATWPMLVAGALAGAGWWAATRSGRSVQVPAGDILEPIEAVARATSRRLTRLRERSEAIVARVPAIEMRERPKRWSERGLRQVERVQGLLGRYEVVGLLLAAVLLLLVAVFILGATR